MKKLEVQGNNSVHHVYVRGNKYQEPEPEEFYVHFPGGQIGIARCSDNTYWAHITTDDTAPSGENIQQQSNMVDARIDSRGLHASEMDIGDMARPDCYHVAVKFEPPA